MISLEDAARLFDELIPTLTTYYSLKIIDGDYIDLISRVFPKDRCYF